MKPYEGFAAMIPLDYGYVGHDPEHSLLLVPDHWDSLRDLLATPFAFLEDAHGRFDYDASTRSFNWETLGPMTIILDPLTVPSRASAEGLRILAAALQMRHDRCCECGRESVYDRMSDQIRNVIPQWQSLNHEEWRDQVIKAASKPGQKCEGLYIVEYALITRVMVIRYIPADFTLYIDNPFYNDNITAVTFSDFLTGMGAHFLPRTAYMHFDLLPAVDPDPDRRTHWTIARLKAEFAVDYIMSPLWTLDRLCDPNQRLVKGLSTHAYNYASASFVHDDSRNPLSITSVSDAEHDGRFPVTEDRQPRLERINGAYDPTVILESVDPWANGWVWDRVPTNPPPKDKRGPDGSDEADGTSFKLDLTQQSRGSGVDDAGGVWTQDGNGSDTPFPCVLIYVTVNGEGQWVVDPSSTLVKNYVAPTQSGGGGSG